MAGPTLVLGMIFSISELLKFHGKESFATDTQFPYSSSFRDRIVSEQCSRRGYQAGISLEA